LYSVKVTPQSAYYMALAATKQKKFPEAIRYYEESAQLEPNPLEKANIYYTLATGLSSGDKSKSKEYLNNALTFDPKMGKAYLFLAQSYSNSKEECGKTDFEKKAVIYLAIQTVKKAGVADPKLKPTADKMEADFKSQSLTQEEIKKSKMNGKSLTIGCWINETITFPSK
jgi:tetratricopeptide (TPR) repeat protein